jgi:hypothetical protein
MGRSEAGKTRAPTRCALTIKLIALLRRTGGKGLADVARER